MLLRTISSIVLCCTAAFAQHDWLIVPGERVGPVTRRTSEEALRRLLGSANVKRDQIHVGEGMYEPGTTIYPRTPAWSLAILWQDQKRLRPATIFVCYSGETKRCRWRTSGGIGFGTTLRELERLNGKAFEMAGFDWDYSGVVTSWQGGKLAALLETEGATLLRLHPRTDANGRWLPQLKDAELGGTSGDQTVSSSLPAMQKLNPRVYFIGVEFAQ